jgi:PleD family two-component response regulator
LEKKILLYNEDIEALSQIRKIFVREGCEVITASNWDTAVKLLSNISIDYIVMNVKNEKTKQSILNAFKPI